MKRNGLETLFMVAVLVGWGLAGQAEAQTGRYIRGSSGIVTSSVPGHYSGRTYGVSHARRHHGPTIAESEVVMKGDIGGCGRCCR